MSSTFQTFAFHRGGAGGGLADIILLSHPKDTEKDCLNIPFGLAVFDWVRAIAISCQPNSHYLSLP